jgi:adenylate kinase family enzyme
MANIHAEAATQGIDLAAAADIIRHGNRFLVIGCSGGGKSTLSRRIADRFGLRYISIDRDILWLPGWVQRERAEQRRIIEEMIAGDRWIMDGTNPSTFDIRVPRSDLVIWMQMPRYLCIWGILSRWVRHYGKTRPDMAPGCPEKMDLEFFHFVWTFEKRFAWRIVDGLARHGGETPLVVVKSRRQMRDLLDLLGARA